ncbi:MAG TPA: hypothetical protein PLX93_05815, partial [Bacilli bacterium]|nr:hypothetical protein [Bacilli bacterium]
LVASEEWHAFSLVPLLNVVNIAYLSNTSNDLGEKYLRFLFSINANAYIIQVIKRALPQNL